ncbi:hypothetical protein D3C84_788880 [compost metagenome]
MWPHSEMQWASSTTSREIGTCWMKLRKRSFFRRSTEIIRIFSSPERALAMTSAAASRLCAESMLAAAMPWRWRKASWSCISASNGDTTRVRCGRCRAGNW